MHTVFLKCLKVNYRFHDFSPLNTFVLAIRITCVPDTDPGSLILPPSPGYCISPAVLVISCSGPAGEAGCCWVRIHVGCGAVALKSLAHPPHPYTPFSFANSNSLGIKAFREECTTIWISLFPHDVVFDRWIFLYSAGNVQAWFHSSFPYY